MTNPAGCPFLATPNTSMSPAKLPRLGLLLVAVALLAGLAGATYVFRFNPEMSFWTQAAERKLDWAEGMRQKYGFVIGAVGGSTTTFGIDAQLMDQEAALPVANLGLHAGMGPDVCVGFGFAALQRGDTLLLCLEPSMLTEEVHPMPLGSRLAWALGKPELLAWDRPPTWLTRLSLLTQMQPGGYHVVTMLGKLAVQEPLYRYNIKDTRPGGLQVTEDRRNFVASMDLSAGPRLAPLSESGLALLERVRDEANRRGIHVAYALPWAYWPADSADLRRAANAEFLLQIEDIMPVLREPNMGVHTVLDDFADSGQHLTEEAAKARSRVLAETLRSKLPATPTPEPPAKN